MANGNFQVCMNISRLTVPWDHQCVCLVNCHKAMWKLLYLSNILYSFYETSQAFWKLTGHFKDQSHVVTDGICPSILDS